MNTISQSSCPVCGSSEWKVFFEIKDVPIFCNLLWSNQQEAQNCHRGDLDLAFCSHCGFISNVAFDPDRLEYTQSYENALDFSPRFQDYAKSLAMRLIERHNLYHKTVLEIGSGKGEFLVLLSTLGNNYGIGFDPSYVQLDQHQHTQDQVKFIQDYYSERYTEYQGDFICCRHTLEHIPQPTQLLKSIKQTIGDQKPDIFFEVPNALETFERLGIWDIIYEHCGYFSPVSMAYAFSSCGFEVDNIEEEFKGQFLCVEAHPGKTVTTLTAEQTKKVKQLAEVVKGFKTKFDQKIDFWKNKLETFKTEGKRVVTWGAGSKGVTFFNFLKMQNPIEYIVDINPRKQRKYVPGTGQKIVSPEFLEEYKPDIVIVMNPIYQEEIKKMLANMGLQNCVLETGV
ncbi:class I SAM-dependent methyltransferase [Lyngbya sp. PCC 8106]|uniref:class I SAM-dependent methyltransferase n=1 Tax=Lyngbya sp. (strain PCC 8106) TaxID=313612 RepID=UPI0000EAB553|nr:class I SAM-dependent methyltransferase [Lyngbya sp. PCC 8106]EAW36495.1 putative sugar nucleotide processing enzyme [Lyngbya sp. PCC 8106]